jgi:hypothetical protein
MATGTLTSEQLIELMQIESRLHSLSDEVAGEVEELTRRIYTIVATFHPGDESDDAANQAFWEPLYDESRRRHMAERVEELREEMLEAEKEVA